MEVFKMNKYYEDLSINFKDKNTFDFVSAYSMFGARWNDEELYSYINGGYGEGKHTTVEEIFKKLPDVFFRLSTGLIISYKY
jgi:hypothetical protein